MPRAVGIDLGTTYSCVAAVVNGKVEVIANRDFGQRTTPSCVTFVEGEERELVGEAALSQAARNPANTIVEAKRLIGRQFMEQSLQADIARWPFAVTERGGRPLISVQHKGEPLKLSPQEVSAKVLRKLKADAEAFLGDVVTDAVITVPAYFTDSQRRATKEAGEMAGLKVLQLIPEPTAAAVAFGVERQSRESRNVLVYDLGGGTFDVSIVEITKRYFEVKAVGGNSHLGGADVDQLVVEYVGDEIKRKLNLDVRGDPRKMRRLVTLCERAKRDLSAVMKANIDVESVVLDYVTIGLTRAKFEELTKGLLNQTADIVKATLDSSKLAAAAIDEVLLVGGSTRMPCVERLLAGLFPGKPISKAVNPDEAVAQGAAIWAAVKAGDDAAMLQGLNVQNVTPLSIGVSVNGGQMSVVIPRNHAIPAKVVHDSLHTAFVDQKSVVLTVYQGESCVVKRNKQIGSFTLHNLPNGPAGRKLDFEMSVDENGVLWMRGKLHTHKNWKSCTMNAEGLSTVDIISNLEDAERYREEDEQELERINARFYVEKFLMNERKNIPSEHMPEFLKIHSWFYANANASTIEFMLKLTDLQMLL